MAKRYIEVVPRGGSLGAAAVKCPECGVSLSREEALANLLCCPRCGRYQRMGAADRLSITIDGGTFSEIATDVSSGNPLDFPGYGEKLERAREASGTDEGVLAGVARVKLQSTAIAVMDPAFMMGSMGEACGERIAELFDMATDQRLPVVVFCASGGARMQEGLVSLMQMAKVSCAVARHREAGLFYLAVLTDPTTGGVTASFATEADVILAEPAALIGFAGRRVIESTVHETLPDDFQSAEFALGHGLIDGIVAREDLRDVIAELLALHYVPSRSDESRPYSVADLREGRRSADFVARGRARRRRRLIRSGASGKGGDPGSGGIAGGGPGKGGGSGKSGRSGKGGISVRGGVAGSRKFFSGVIRKGIGVAGQAAQTVTEAAGQAAESVAESVAGEGAVDEGAAGSSYAAGADAYEAAQIPLPPDEHSDEELRATVSSARESGVDTTAYEHVQLARRTDRPTATVFRDGLVDGFLTMHGDRAFADDPACVCGLGFVGGRPVTVITQEKGVDTASRVAHNFGCMHPEGYRKAARLARQAEAFHRPVVCLVDTQGAHCDAASEERGQGNAISECLTTFATLRVPVVTVILSEGGSGGALALAVADRVAMLENAVYSILTPEGFASILWRDASRAVEAASAMRLTAAEVLEMGIVDAVIAEEGEGAHANVESAVAAVREWVIAELDELAGVPADELVRARQERYARRYSGGE